MEYPKEFIEKVKAESLYLYELLINDNRYFGNFLRAMSNFVMSPEEMLDDFKAGRRGERVKQEVEKAIRYQKLHDEWRRISGEK